MLTDVADCLEVVRHAPIGETCWMNDYGPLTLAGKIQREFDRRGKLWFEKVNQAAADGMQINISCGDPKKSVLQQLLDSLKRNKG